MRQCDVARTGGVLQALMNYGMVLVRIVRTERHRAGPAYSGVGRYGWGLPVW